MLKAFVICKDIADNPGNKEQKDLQGAGLSQFVCGDRLPLKVSFWVFVQLSDEKETGEIRFALMRADSGRYINFPPISIRHKNVLQPDGFGVRFYDCIFPVRGIYFLELWYNNEWIVDQRLEVT
jgi:hypothetical protein